MLPRLSSRTAWPQVPNALLVAVDARRAAGLPLIDLTVSNPSAVGLGPDARQLTALADRRAASYTPEALGLPSARRAVAAYYAARGVAVDPASIVLTASTSEAYAFLFALLADVGDEVLVPAPSYPLFGFLADLAGVTLVPYPLVYDAAWSIDIDALRAAVTPRTRAALVVSPNNPTGSFLKRDELAELRRLAATHGLALIADEVFADYAFAPDVHRAPSLAAERDGLAFALSGLSKVAALPQLKLGWIVVAGEPAATAAALERLELVADTFLSVGTPPQLALPALLASAPATRASIAERTARNLVRARAAIGPASPATLLTTEGGWYATLRIPATRSEIAWGRALLDVGVYAHPGHFYDFAREAYLVVSLLPAEPQFAHGIAALIDLVDRA